jgi:secreted PhoX family phosphatase
MLSPDELLDEGVCGLNESLGPRICEATAARVAGPEAWPTETILRAGDPLAPGVVAARAARPTAAEQERRFGFGGDVIACVPLPDPGADGRRQVLVVASHNRFAASGPGTSSGAGREPREISAASAMATSGLSVVELRRLPGESWRAHSGSHFNRRLTAATWIALSGPAAGHPWLSTFYDPTGLRVRGTLGNRAGGRTAWGTVLSGEADFVHCFGNVGALAADDPRRAAHEAFGLATGAGRWQGETAEPRFDAAHEPNEAFRFGWMLEVDPYDPNSAPHKRTALGRLRHAAAAACVSRDGRVVVYLADGAPGGCFYKFVSAGRYHCRQRQANLGLLDDGELRVAVFHPDGSGEWRPLEQGRGALIEENGFVCPGDVQVQARRAGALAGGTRWGLPGCVQINPATGRVLALAGPAVLAAGVCPSEGPCPPRGTVLQLAEARNDAAAAGFGWRPIELLAAAAQVKDFTFDQVGNAWLVCAGLGRPDVVQIVPVSDGPGDHGFGAATRFEAAVGRVEFSPDYQTAFHMGSEPGADGPALLATFRGDGAAAEGFGLML